MNKITVAKLAKSYVENQFFKLLLIKSQLETENNEAKRKNLHTRAKKAVLKAQQAVDYAKKVADEAARLEADSKKAGIKELYFVKEARAHVSEAKQYVDYAQGLLNEINVKPAVETKQEAELGSLEAEI